MKIIGITGHKTEGKTELATALEPYGFKRYAFADPVKELAKELGWDQTKRDPDDYLNGAPPWLAFSPGAFNGRLLLDKIGMGARRIIGPSVWIQALERKLFPPIEVGPTAVNLGGPIEDVVIDDVRFLNEAAAIRGWGGKVVRVIRKGVVPQYEYESEREVSQIPVDYFVLNCRDLEWLWEQAPHIIRELEL